MYVSHIHILVNLVDLYVTVRETLRLVGYIKKKQSSHRPINIAYFK